MDKITKGLLAEFSSQFELGDKEDQESARFEAFSAYLVVQKHYGDAAFDPPDLVVGKGDDTGIDGIAIVVNNNLVYDVDSVSDLAALNGYVEATFVFVQAERTEGFDGAKIGTFGTGVRDFFGAGRMPRNDDIKNSVEIMEEVYKFAGKFSRGKPRCFLYYVTTGKWNNDRALVARAQAEMEDLRATGLFESAEFTPIGAEQIQTLYNQARNSITREFNFPKRTSVPEIPNVKEAYLGLLPALDYLSLVCDDQNQIIKSVFYENVRDWEEYNRINDGIRQTLDSDERRRFCLMNNGITIIAKSLTPVGDKFSITDFQIVNGCQTSHVLNDNRGLLGPEIQIPVRIISTKDEGVTESVIRATNSQTEVKPDQFFAMKGFAKKLEAFFKTYDADHRLYYERRTHQYDSLDIPKARIVSHPNLVRAVGAMFLNEPHRTTRNYKALSDKVGGIMFNDNDKPEPYYLAAYTAFRLGRLFSSKTIPSKWSSGRYHMLLAARLLMDAKPKSPMNANEMTRRCEAMIREMWDRADDILLAAVQVIVDIAGENWTRDEIRTQPVTDKILAKFGLRGDA